MKTDIANNLRKLAAALMGSSMPTMPKVPKASPQTLGPPGQQGKQNLKGLDNPVATRGAK